MRVQLCTSRLHWNMREFAGLERRHDDCNGLFFWLISILQLVGTRNAGRKASKQEGREGGRERGKERRHVASDCLTLPPSITPALLSLPPSHLTSPPTHTTPLPPSSLSHLPVPRIHMIYWTTFVFSCFLYTPKRPGACHNHVQLAIVYMHPTALTGKLHTVSLLNPFDVCTYLSIESTHRMNVQPCHLHYSLQSMPIIDFATPLEWMKATSILSHNYILTTPFGTCKPLPPALISEIPVVRNDELQG